jgi:medium-chain acyl-[acyl-carrier-protein] hydrolase
MGAMSLWPTPWLAHGQRSKDAQYRIFPFTCAGGGASSYKGWNELLPASVDICPIQLPGRESRASEDFVVDLHELVDGVAEAIEPFLDLPFALFGHSLGGLLAFEVARDLRHHGSSPEALIVAGTPAPHLPRQRPPVHQLPEDELLNYLIGLNGTPEELLQQEWLLRMYLPVLRADMKALETYVYARDTPLDTPIIGLYGREDPQVSLEEVHAWATHSTRPLLTQDFAGGHFFVRESAGPLVKCIASHLGLQPAP